MSGETNLPYLTEERGLGARFACSALMLAAWLVSQSFEFTHAPVFSYLNLAVSAEDGGYLIMAALCLLLNNGLRAVLLYSGWFMLSDALADLLGRRWIALVTPPAAIPVSYMLTGYFKLPSVPHFGVPAFFTLLSVWVLQYAARDVTRRGYKFLVQAVLVVSIQWLDLIPLLTPYGFGWGELSMTIKRFAEMMDKASLLNVMCSAGFAFCACVAVLLMQLFIGYEKQLRQLSLLRARERELTRMRSQQARARLYQEMQYLVHDLKRPLTAVLGLADLLSLSADEATAAHAKTIMASAEKMDQMISEIRNPDSVRRVPLRDLFDYTMAQVRPLDWGGLVCVVLPEELKETPISVNLIRFSRVLVNLLDNAHHATADCEKPEIVMRAEQSGGGALIIVEDNGPGFIGAGGPGKSTWGSSGLGLSFVRDAVEDNNGTVRYGDRPGGGAKCSVWIPSCKESGEGQ